jgi:Ca-activated chloride channel family protein
MCSYPNIRNVVVMSLLALAPLQVHAAGLLIADGGFGGQLEIKQHDVQVTINNGIAVTQITQVFHNTENRIVEALYTFPVPKGASVSNFSMIIGGKEMIGEVVEKQRAREIYESYKQTRRDPGLLEQVDYKRFEMRVFPIAAGADQQVQVTYYQELDFDHDWASYVYPLATVTKPGVDQRTQGRFGLSVDVRSEVPIEEFSSSSHPEELVVAAHGSSYWQASLEADGGDLSRDVVLNFRIERPHTGVDLVTSKTPDDDGYFQLTITAGKELEELSQGMDYVFVLDISGSMANDGKLRMSRNSISAFADAIGPEDRFELITFNIAPNALFNSLTPVNDESRQQAITFLESQKARGGTVLRPALNTAYRYVDPDRTLNVVVLSDGMTEVREQAELLQLVAARPAGSRVFCIGVGNEVNRPLLSQIAKDAGGLAAFVSQGDDFQRQAEAFRRKLMRPAVTELGIRIDGVAVYDVEPQQLPNLYHGSPLRIYGRYRGGGRAQVTFEGDALGAPFAKTVEMELPKVDAGNPEIERIWAWHRVQKLMDDVRRQGAAGGQEASIVQLCEQYSIVSEYASFIVLENDAEYRRWKIERKNAGRVQRDRAARQVVQQQLADLRRKAEAQMGPAPQTADADVTADALATAVPTSKTPAAAATPPAAASPQIARNSGSANSFDLDLPARRSPVGGGGAIDPLSALLALSATGAAAAAEWRRRKRIERVS